MNRWQAFKQLVLCRVREFYREPEAIFWVYGFPLILALGLGIAFSESKPEPPAVDVQGSPTDPAIKALIERLKPTKDGLKHVEAHSADECLSRLKQGKTALFIVPEAKGRKYRYDETRAEGVLARWWADSLLVRSEPNAPPPPQIDPIQEPGNRYIDFLVPGLIGMNLMGGGLFGVGFVLVDMRVRKLFKRLMATPMNRADFLLSIFASRLLFMIPELLVLLGVGLLVFGVPIKGDPLTLILVFLMGAAAFSGLGLLIASRTEKTETVSGLMNLIMLPMYLLSGTFFSSKRFPDVSQPFIQALPLTQLNDALREVMLEGKSVVDVAWRLGILLAWAAGAFFLALRWFRWR